MNKKGDGNASDMNNVTQISHRAVDVAATRFTQVVFK